METNEKQRSRAEENFTGKPESKLLTFVKKHLLVFSLLAIIICIILGFMIKINIMERSSLAEKELLVNLYENKMDSLSLSDMELTSRVFSWAIRSEMTRQNLEQVNLFIKRLVKEPNISKIQLIDPATATVLLSSDKKEEGTIIENTLILQAEKTVQLSDDAGITIISPVMGLDSRIGILVIELEKN